MEHLVDPQLKRVLEQFTDGAVFFHDSEDEEEVLPGFGRAKANGFIREIGGGGFSTGTHYELTRLGREAIGLPKRSKFGDKIAAFFSR